MHPETSAPKAARDNEAARIARRVEAQRRALELARRQLDEPMLTTTAVFILATVALAAIVGALYWALQ